MTTPIVITAFVHPSEQPALRFAAAQLARQLGPVTWPVTVRFPGHAEAVPDGALVVASLLADLADHAVPLAQVERRWRGWLAGIAGRADVFLCTASRVAGAAERARRLNRLGAELSRESGAHIVDIDRVFGLLGARAIGAGPAADEVAGHVIVRCLLACGLDQVVPQAVLDRAQAASPEIVAPARRGA